MQINCYEWKFQVIDQHTVSWHPGKQSHSIPIVDLLAMFSNPVALSGGAMLFICVRIWSKQSMSTIRHIRTFELSFSAAKYPNFKIPRQKFCLLEILADKYLYRMNPAHNKNRLANISSKQNLWFSSFVQIMNLT